MNELVSIIIPVYNVKDYLQACVLSAVNQDYDNKEILLIDDGATDGSSEMCDELQSQYQEVFAFHKENGGLSSARNYGMTKAKGEYYFFLDSDDTIAHNCVSFLVSMIHRYSVKLATVDVKPVYDPGHLEDIINECDSTVIKRDEALVKMFARYNMGVSACGKLFHKSLFENISFPVGKLYEDLQTIPYVFHECDSIAYSKSNLYYWYQRPNSIMHRNLKETDYELFDYMDELLAFVQKDSPMVIDGAVCRYISDSFFTIIYRMTRDDYAMYYPVVKSRLKRLISTTIRNPYLKANKKIQTVLFVYTPHIYMIMVKIFMKRKIKLI